MYNIRRELHPSLEDPTQCRRMLLMKEKKPNIE